MRACEAPRTTVANVDRDFTEWHRGVAHAYVWAFEAPVDVGPARSALEGYLLPRCERQPHVTVCYAGLAGRGFDDARLRSDLTRLAPSAGQAVELAPVRWGSFAQAPTIELGAPWAERAHRLLAHDDPVRALDPYVPHVTVGLYCGVWPIDEPLARLARLPLPGRWTASELLLLRYDTHDVAGPLTRAGALDLRTGRYAAT